MRRFLLKFKEEPKFKFNKIRNLKAVKAALG
jgi:hypothetical protein